jgi:hypothetical protein
MFVSASECFIFKITEQISIKFLIGTWSTCHNMLIRGQCRFLFIVSCPTDMHFALQLTNLISAAVIQILSFIPIA